MYVAGSNGTSRSALAESDAFHSATGGGLGGGGGEMRAKHSDTDDKTKNKRICA